MNKDPASKLPISINATPKSIPPSILLDELLVGVADAVTLGNAVVGDSDVTVT